MQDFLSKLSPKEKKIFYVAVFVVAVALLDRLFLSPATNRIDTLKQKIAVTQDGLQKDHEFLTFEDRINDEVASYAQYVPTALKDDDEINTELFRTIERMAKTSKVELIKSNPAQIKDNPGYIEYYANLDIAGSFEDVIGFMHALNASKELFKVVRFDMSPQRGDTSKIQTALTIVKLVIKPTQS